MFEQLPDIYVDSCDHEPVPAIDISSIDDTNDTVAQKEANENTEIHLSLSI